MVAGVLAACRALEPLAGAAVALWARFAPDDRPLTGALDGWTVAGSVLEAGGASLTRAAELIDRGWPDGADRCAFDAHLAAFQQEIGEWAADAKHHAETLADLIRDLDALQQAAAAVAARSLLTLALLGGLADVPGVAPYVRAAQRLTGLALAVATGELVAEVVAVLGRAYRPMVDWISGAELSVAGARPYAGEAAVRIDFRDVSIHWA
jgi:hypothetical protein